MVSAPATASAQRTRAPVAPNVAQAAARFDRGVQLAREGDFAGALAEFEAAYALSANAEILFNIAAAHENLNHYVEAADTLAQYRARASGASLARRGTELDAATARIESRIGRIVVALDIEGMEVTVDDRPFTAAQARAGIRASAGERRVVVRAPRYVQREQRVTVAGGEVRTITAPLVRTQSGLMVECNVRGARVEVDGRELARTPIESSLVVDEGRHTVRVSAPGYSSYETVVDAIEGGASVRAQLSWLDDIPVGVASRLIVRTNERGGFASVDRRRVAMDGSVALPPGVHRLRVELPGFVPSEREVTLSSGDALTVDVAMRPTAAYRLAYDQHAQLMRSLWVGTAIAGYPVFAATGVVFFYLLARNLGLSSDISRLDDAINECGRTACSMSRTLIEQQRMAQQSLNDEYLWLWASGVSFFIGAGLAITSFSLFAIAPPTDRFTRAPVFRVGMGPGSMTATLRF